MNEEKILFDKFEIIETLKKDAQSGVYLADHIYLNKQIILKTLNTINLKEQSTLHRFKREAKILAKLDHPNIIKVLDFGTFGEFFYISFEYFESQSLRNFLRHNKISLDSFKIIATQILSGLDYAHKQKIIHRDLKPENILINNKLNVKIADFGLALSKNEPQITQQQSIVGTPGYMSPEQIHGEELDQRSDIFSFGIIAFEILTCKNPFIGSDIASTINNILFLDTSNINKELEKFPENIGKTISKCLEKNRANRFQTVEEVIKSFDFEIEQSKSSIEISQKKKTTAKYPLIFVLLLIAITGIIYFLLSGSNEVTRQSPVITRIEDKGEKADTDLQLSLQSEQSSLNNQKNQNLSFEISKEKPNQTKENLELPEGSLEIICYPWAEVYLNNEKFETTPLTNPINLKPGNYRLKLVHPHFPPIEKNIVINPRETTIIDVNFYKNFGFIQFRIIPWGEVKVNNQKIGVSPFPKPQVVYPGRNIIEIYNPAYGFYVDTVIVQKSETLFYNLNFNNISNWHKN